MAHVAAFVVALGCLVLLLALAAAGGSAVLRARLRTWRRTRTGTTGAVSKLPRLTSSPRIVEVTYLDPAGRPHVLRQRWPGAWTGRLGVGSPVTVWHRTDRPEVAAVDSPRFGVLAAARRLRATAAIIAVPGLLAVLVGIALALLVRWGHLG